MNNLFVEIDTRNKKDDYVTRYFNEHGIKWIRNKLYAGDIKLLNSTRVIIDLKANLEEIAHNLCNKKEHERVLREIKRAKEIECEEFIFLIKDDEIKTYEDVINWTSKRTKVKGLTLCKIMRTMKQRYGVRFILCSEAEAPKKILELLESKGEE